MKYIYQVGGLLRKALGQRDLTGLTTDQQVLYNSSLASLKSIKYMDQAARDNLIEKLPSLILSQPPERIHDQISKMVTLDIEIANRQDAGYQSPYYIKDLNDAAQGFADPELRAQSPVKALAPLPYTSEPPATGSLMELPASATERPSVTAAANSSPVATPDANPSQAELDTTLVTGAPALAADAVTVQAPQAIAARHSPDSAIVASNTASGASADNASRLGASVDLDQLHKAELELSTRIQSLKSEGKTPEDAELRALKEELKQLQAQNRRIITAAMEAGTLSQTYAGDRAAGKVKRRTETPDELTLKFNGMSTDEQMIALLTCQGVAGNSGSILKIVRLIEGRTEDEYKQDLLRLYRVSKNVTAFYNTLEYLTSEQISRKNAVKQTQAAALGEAASGSARPTPPPGAPKAPIKGRAPSPHGATRAV
jgi:hypothetical protein